MRYLGFGLLGLVFLGIALATYFSPFISGPDISGLGFAHQEAFRAGIAGLLATALVGLAGYLVIRFAKQKNGSSGDSSK